MNPTFHKIKGIDVISIFKRKENEEKTDGNPLVYAIQNKNGWSINQKELMKLFKQFIKISGKLNTKYDTACTVATSNKLNKVLLNKLVTLLKVNNKIEDVFQKYSVSEIYECGLSAEDASENDWNKLNKSLKDMIKDNNGVFSYKFIKGKHLRNYIKSSCHLTKGIEDYAELFNDKDVLIVDDIVSSGKTLSDSVIAIKETFTPKSITVITLFSPLE